MKISVVGTGYVGLVSGACLAAKGHQVICVDVDEHRVKVINERKAPFYEAQLDDLLKKTIPEFLKATTDLDLAIRESDLTMIAVGTPFDGQTIDLTAIKEAARSIGTALRAKTDYHVVVVKSTVVPGTTQDVVLPLLEKASARKAGVHFGVGMNPEFLREGEAVSDFMFPDRIVLGGIDERSIDQLDNIYSGFPDADRLRTNTRTAEMIKYTANALLATMISFSNEIGNLCQDLGGIDVADVMKGVHLDKRLSPLLPNGERIVPSFLTYLKAGCGFGGSCFPKDVMALQAHGTKIGTPMRILEAVMTVNRLQPAKILVLLKKHFPSLNNVSVAVLGLSFKPGTDDIRESPSILIIKELLALGAKVKAYDPVAASNPLNGFTHSGIVISENLEQAINGVQAIVVATQWEEFSKLPLFLSDMDPKPVLIDGRRMLNKKQFSKYEGIGV